MSKRPATTRSTKVWRGVMGGGASLGTAGLIAFAHATFALKDDVRDLRRDVQELRETAAQLDWEVNHRRAVATNR